jgi:predicted Zn-dependent protease
MIYGLSIKRISFTLLMVLISTIVINAQDVSRDQKMGAEAKKMVETSMGIYDDAAKTKVINELGTRLANHLNNKLFNYEFYIVDMGEPNAFALPGGYIYFTRGILALANNEDELAGVMGHEIIHSNNRHSMKQQKTGILSGILSLPQALTGALLGENAAKLFSPLTKGGEAVGASHSRKDEYEADKLGVTLSANSGYDPGSLASILNNLNQTIEAYTGKKEEPSYFSSHPLTSKRIENINKESAKLKAAGIPKIFKDQKDFLRFIDGIMVGPNPKQGVFQGNAFIQPELNFRFDVPESWLKENTTTAVATGDTAGTAMVMLEIDSSFKSAGEAAKKFSTDMQKKIGQELEITSKTINGFTCKATALEMQEKKEVIKYSFYWIEYNNLIYKFTAAAKKGHEKQAAQIVESFRTPTNEELESINYRSLKVVECVKGDNIQTVSEREKNLLPANLTAAINSIPQDVVFSEGDLIKIVIQVPYK